MGVRHSLLVNSGSSANLVAISALTSAKLPAERRIKPGDEVITVAAGFPTTVAPIVQVGAVPVFIDAHPITGNARCEQLEEAYAPGKTKAVMMAHALGNPFDLAATLAFCRKYGLWLVEDNCDALGCSYSMPRALAESLGFSENSPGLDDGPDRVIRWTGTWGDISTQSFYPPHHLTMGEGGAVNIVSDQKLRVVAESFRDWGRDCWCPSGIDNTCNKRFGWQLGELPEGYDHKYTYSHLGYNLKPLDIQAAIGRVQLKRLPEFIEARKRNWEILRRGLAPYDAFLEFALPSHATAWDAENGFSWDDSGCRTDCSWFGFKIATRPGALVTRTDLAQELDRNQIGNRMLFGGNLLRQPAFVQLREDNPQALRVIGAMEGADEIMNNTLFLGTYPGMTEAMLQAQVRVIGNFLQP
jgi:CDP-6-deoxy-D-xylo-4-hexulose-3-dehydrase